MSNALKFSEPGNNLNIEIGKKDDNLLFIITDYGLRIPENELETIFDKFIQSSSTKTTTGGTILGLSICKKIILGHQGKIWTEHNPTSGAGFYFLIPINVELKNEQTLKIESTKEQKFA